MKHQLNFTLFFILFLILSCQSVIAQTLTKPKDFFGFEPGSDRNLFDYEQLISYFKKLDQGSSRIEMREIGQSPMGKPIYIVFISSEENIKRLDELAEINRKLALDPDLKADEVKTYINKGKVFLLATLSMHSSEVGPAQSSPLVAYSLAATNDPAKLDWLREVVYMIVPTVNPDGMDMIVSHYRKYKGTKYEDSEMPGLYHKYAGHDNNRDFITLSQSDTRAISQITSKTWFPQVMVDQHQMSGSSVRYFVPPNHDPIAENVDEGLWNWAGVFGSNLIKDLTREGCSGIAQKYNFDHYWAGSNKTCLWKNVTAFLTEAASCNLATPVYIEPTELTVSGKGLAEYKKSTNMPLPWPGGWWRLADIVKLEVETAYSVLNTCRMNKNEILKFRNDLCKKEVNKGKTEAPYYYILPPEQHDKSEWFDLSRLLTEHGVNVYSLARTTVIEGKQYNPGSFVIPLSQPFRPFIKEVMEVQEYPVRHYSAGGEIIKPYDVTSWSLPLHKGVSCDEINSRNAELEKNLELWNPVGKQKNNGNLAAVFFSVDENASFKTAFMASSAGLKVQRLTEDLVFDNKLLKKGSFFVNTAGSGNSKVLDELVRQNGSLPISAKDIRSPKLADFAVPKIALIETWYADIDAGWTRFVFDNYGIPYKVLHPEDFEKSDPGKEFDVLVFPGKDPDVLMRGKLKSSDGSYRSLNLPPGFTKGIGEKGLDKILKFLDNGGKVISWGESANLFTGPLKLSHPNDETEEFSLPVQDDSKSIISKGFYCPGSLLTINMKKDHPLTLGMQEQIGVFYRGKPAFKTSEPWFDMDRRIIATFPEKNILKSGYVENEELIGNKAAMVWLKKGKGQMVLFAFNPQFRASTPVTYKLLFNALLLDNDLENKL